ncbi:hypothetical protein P3H15_33225 [Rhodococcus sp. T2V]|uniref:hypothetical protein n=1 Tax=Rhodococcus sp. T2V TaxID=3034164 RepID=UPI0023E19B59|nr:hypothetical protein [Rhodococcus sp. T2V]MDF3309882.1 hypothetical protein [Rhodococcus sp. T2V]
MTEQQAEDDSYPDSWRIPGRTNPSRELKRGVEDYLAALSEDDFAAMVARTRQPKR